MKKNDDLTSGRERKRRLALLALGRAKTNLDPAAGSCPESEEMAGLLDGTLPRQARREMQAHLAACERCYREWLTLSQQQESHEAASISGVRLISFVSRPTLLKAIGSACAVTMGIVLFLAVPFKNGGDNTEILQAPAPYREQSVPAEPAPLAATGNQLESARSADKADTDASSDAVRKPRATTTMAGSAPTGPLQAQQGEAGRNHLDATAAFLDLKRDLATICAAKRPELSLLAGYAKRADAVLRVQPGLRDRQQEQLVEIAARLHEAQGHSADAEALCRRLQGLLVP